MHGRVCIEHAEARSPGRRPRRSTTSANESKHCNGMRRSGGPCHCRRPGALFGLADASATRKRRHRWKRRSHASTHENHLYEGQFRHLPGARGGGAARHPAGGLWRERHPHADRHARPLFPVGSRGGVPLWRDRGSHPPGTIRCLRRDPCLYPWRRGRCHTAETLGGNPE